MITYLLLFLVFFIGIITSYEDFKYTKIRNKWILFGLVGGAVIYLFALAYKLMPLHFLYILLINTLISLLIGVIFWYFDWWSAGDAKLFMIFAWLVPVQAYSRAALPIFLSFVILVNTFIFFVFALFAQSFFFLVDKVIFYLKMEKEKRRNNLRIFYNKISFEAKHNILKHLRTFSGIILLYIFFQIFRLEMGDSLIDLKWLQLVSFLFAVIIGFLWQKIFKRNWVLILLIIGLFAYGIIKFIFSDMERLNILFFINNFLSFIIIFLLTNWLGYYVKSTEKKPIHFAFWLFSGVILTIIFQGSILRLLH